MHQLALLQDEVRDLRKANETLSKRRNRKTRLQVGGSLNLQEAQALMDKRDIAD
jgi:triosephosphate isomerase